MGAGEPRASYRRAIRGRGRRARTANHGAGPLSLNVARMVQSLGARGARGVF